MSLPDRSEIEPVLREALDQAATYLAGLDDRPALAPDVAARLSAFDGPLPEQGTGAIDAVRFLAEHGVPAATATAGPKFFHFVVGGVTPAAFGADLLTAVLDQPAYAWASSPLGVHLEVLALRWLRELFKLPAEWTGVMTTGATMANFVGLAAARQWWAERHGRDPSRDGLAGLPPVPVFSSGHIHASAVKCLAMLGIGRDALHVTGNGPARRLDPAALDHALRQLDGAPAIVIANAGEVNAGEFDPIREMLEIARRHGAWLHVDGAFGLFARISPRTRHLADGVDEADSVTVDGHKWLNVPYDCGFSFVRDVGLLKRAFAYSADYLPGPDDPRPNFGSVGPESSRRARALAVWATLRAYGRVGHRHIVERHLDLALHLADRVDAAPDLERLAPVQINIVCFRYNPGGLDDAALDVLNERLGRAILEDGRVFAGTTKFEGRVALRPALSNWRTREADVDLLVDVVRELGASIADGLSASR
jgi:glutamate/tyrosine decarboxylase-like PLP-dependent enzyme